MLFYFHIQFRFMKYNGKKLVLLCGLIILFSFLISWDQPGKDDGRNLKVLPKNISSDSLERVMDGFVTALGVDCAFCHAQKDPLQPKKLDYASDSNHLKDVTRTMLRMTMEMNSKYMTTLPNQNVQFVTCNTCHRGEPMPGK
jgi:hypothetical protein